MSDEYRIPARIDDLPELDDTFIKQDPFNKTWDELKNNEYSLNEYMEQRSQFLNNPNLDWSDVLEVVLPKLNDNKEYIGIINLRKNKLYVSRMEASTTTINDISSSSLFMLITHSLD